MAKSIKLLLLCLVLFCLPKATLEAQDRYQLTSNQELVVLGSSTLHNWEMVTDVAEGGGLFWFEEGKLTNAENLEIAFEAASLESGRGAIMDRNARRALKAEEHPQIIFKLTELITDEEGSQKAKGELTAGGVTRLVTFSLNCRLNNGKVQARGMAHIKLTDFEIKPPVALAGTLKTGDAVSLEFILMFEKETL